MQTTEKWKQIERQCVDRYSIFCLWDIHSPIRYEQARSKLEYINMDVGQLKQLIAQKDRELRTVNKDLQQVQEQSKENQNLLKEAQRNIRGLRQDVDKKVSVCVAFAPN